jgi:hypothetical protein
LLVIVRLRVFLLFSLVALAKMVFRQKTTTLARQPANVDDLAMYNATGTSWPSSLFHDPFLGLR